MPGKRVFFDDETWAALDMLAKDRMMDFQKLSEEAFRDLLRKYGRPASRKEALRRSAGKTGMSFRWDVRKRRARSGRE